MLADAAGGVLADLVVDRREEALAGLVGGQMRDIFQALALLLDEDVNFAFVGLEGVLALAEALVAVFQVGGLALQAVLAFGEAVFLALDLLAHLADFPFHVLAGAERGFFGIEQPGLGFLLGLPDEALGFAARLFTGIRTASPQEAGE